ncbi:anti-repressor SinI family protein [Bacillus nitroreducens]
MVNDVQNRNEQLDQEWIDLILEAVELGISVQDIQNFLQTKTA